MGLDWKKLLTIAAAIGVGVLFWSNPVLYPLKLLTVLVHESGHALAAKLVGGTVESITIDQLEGGLCTFRFEPTFWNQVVTASAGYLGSALSGALLLLVTVRWRAGRFVLAALSLGLLVVTVLWARSFFTVGVALGMSVALGLAARFLPVDFSQVLATFIAVFNSLYALFDLRDDLWSAERRAGTDAALLEKATHIPSVVWAGLWSLLAIALLGGALWLSTKGRRKEEPKAQPAPK